MRHRHEMHGLSGLARPWPQPADVNVDGPRVAGAAGPPDAIEQLDAALDAAGMPGERLEEAELLRAQVDGSTIAYSWRVATSSSEPSPTARRSLPLRCAGPGSRGGQRALPWSPAR